MTESRPHSPAPDDLPWIFEALLFVSEEPQPLATLAAAAGVGEASARDALSQLAAQYRARGLRVMEDAGRFQIVTADEAAPYIEQLLGQRASQKLSRAALEVLSIIAFKQPCSRAEIEAIRGVNSDRVVAQLEARGLIEAVGQAENPGRARLYHTTMKFLEHFGFQSRDELPPLPPGPAAEAPGTL